MEDYKQPGFYHFSEDSIELAKYAHKILKLNKSLTVLDLGCGCGVVGIEFCNLQKNTREIVFVEKQKEFIPYLEYNIENLLMGTKYKIIDKNILNLSITNKFDLIISNPPYYINGSGREAKCENKKQCHFFTEREMTSFLTTMKTLKNENGIALFTARIDQPFISNLVKLNEIIEVKCLGKTSIFKLT